MPITISTVLIVLAATCFLMDAIDRRPQFLQRLKMFPLGVFFLVLTILV